TNQGTYSIGITADTEIHIPQQGNDSSPTGLIEGAQASVKAIEDPEGTYTAVQIHVIPGKPAQVHHVGTVTADNRAVDGTLTITWKDGTTSTVQVNSSTVYLPKEADTSNLNGKLVTVISPRNVSGGESPAKGIVIHPDKEK
ncbi:MAG: hypothetical protein IH585_05325, partial [Anaerolineaceae bacterium]|nr:hypothetical protein [Anaerolineaceae bacterium]